MNKEERIIAALINLYNKMARLNNSKMKDSFGAYTSSEVHCIDHIGKNPDSNVTKLAESFYMTRGAISKMTQKLIKKGAVQPYQKPHNKKEIYFRLTQEGKNIHKTHENLHKQFRERDKPVFDQLSDQQFDSILSFIQKYDTHLQAKINEPNSNIQSQ